MKPSDWQPLRNRKLRRSKTIENSAAASIRKWMDHAGERLSGVSETAGLDVQVLLAHTLGRTRSWTLAHPEAELSPSQLRELEEKILRLEKGEPLPYVLGEWEFYGLTLAVGPGVLIPRPETELLVDKALSWLRAHADRRCAAEVGTGSGCIAVALARNVADLQILASDVSVEALQIARKNIQAHYLADRVRLVQADIFPEKLAEPAIGDCSAPFAPFDLVCANLPYIPTHILEGLKVRRWEPQQALDGGPDGLRSIRRLLGQLSRYWAPGGLALLEIEASQGPAVMELARAEFPGAEISVLPDLAGLDRLLSIQNP